VPKAGRSGSHKATPHIEARLESTVHHESKAHAESRRHPNGCGEASSAAASTRSKCDLGMIPTASGVRLGYGLGITRLGDWVGHNGAIYGFSTETFYDRSNGAEITATANLSSNFSESTTELFVRLADDLYPGSLRPR
jgi:hypothetical protein